MVHWAGRARSRRLAPAQTVTRLGAASQVGGAATSQLPGEPWARDPPDGGLDGDAVNDAGGAPTGRATGAPTGRAAGRSTDRAGGPGWTARSSSGWAPSHIKLTPRPR